MLLAVAVRVCLDEAVLPAVVVRLWAEVVEAAVTVWRRLCALAGVAASEEYAIAKSASAGKIAFDTFLYCRTDRSLRSGQPVLL